MKLTVKKRILIIVLGILLMGFGAIFGGNNSLMVTKNGIELVPNNFGVSVISFGETNVTSTPVPDK